MRPISRWFTSPRPRTWLDSPCAPHLWTLELQNLQDPFNAEGLWDAALGDEPDASDPSGRRDRRLRQALHDHRRWVKRREHGKLVEEGQAFTDVVVMLPKKAWNDQLRLGMTRLEVLIDNLEQAHARDFEDILPAGRAPRYLARPDPLLPPDRVRFHFGYGVHVPAEGEMPLLELLMVENEDAPPRAFTPWVHYRDGQPLERLVGLYADQDAQILCARGPLDCPWFTPDTPGYVLLRRGARGEWEGFGDDVHTEFLGRRPATREQGPRWVFGSLADVDRPPLILELDAPMEPGAAGYEKTLAPGGPPPGLRPLALWLDALVLPRLPRELRGWTLWLDPDGRPAAPDAPRDLALSWDGRRLQLSGRQFPIQTLNPPETVSLPKGALRLEEAPAGSSGVAMLCLPEPVRLPIERERFEIGRFDPRPGANQADLLLDLLDQPGSLRWRGRDLQGSLGNLGLGRHHAALELREDALLVSAAGSLPVVLFDARRHALQAAEPGEDAEPRVLKRGQFLLAGCYWLRFDDDL